MVVVKLSGWNSAKAVARSPFASWSPTGDCSQDMEAVARRSICAVKQGTTSSGSPELGDRLDEAALHQRVEVVRGDPPAAADLCVGQPAVVHQLIDERP